MRRFLASVVTILALTLPSVAAGDVVREIIRGEGGFVFEACAGNPDTTIIGPVHGQMMVTASGRQLISIHGSGTGDVTGAVLPLGRDLVHGRTHGVRARRTPRNHKAHRARERANYIARIVAIVSKDREVRFIMDDPFCG